VGGEGGMLSHALEVGGGEGKLCYRCAPSQHHMLTAGPLSLPVAVRACVLFFFNACRTLGLFDRCVAATTTTNQRWLSRTAAGDGRAGRSRALYAGGGGEKPRPAGAGGADTVAVVRV